MSNVSGCCPAEGMVGIIHLEKSTRVTIGSFRRMAPTKPVRLTTHWAFHARRSISKHASQTLPFISVEIDPDPIQRSSIARPEGFGATEELAVPSFCVKNSKAHLTGVARA